MKPVKKRKATGLFAELLAEIDPISIACTRNKMMLAAKIADAMKAKGLTQKQMAAEMGKSESEVSDWLSGDRNFTVDTLTEIGLFLKVRLVDTSRLELYINSVPLEMSASKKQESSVYLQNSNWSMGVSVACENDTLAKAS